MQKAGAFCSSIAPSQPLSGAQSLFESAQGSQKLFTKIGVLQETRVFDIYQLKMTL